MVLSPVARRLQGDARTVIDPLAVELRVAGERVPVTVHERRLVIATLLDRYPEATARQLATLAGVSRRTIFRHRAARNEIPPTGAG